eukprot:TRINITY_DN9770_c0_g1_i1.p1 TRINITY_DN9770_c0_g1~~TRINITY_DN9770_c0_g1_i1.p1  ORF type:complete len:400 (-),score=76.07 TRINITY_DN9770_c0_g1_i1:66-1265(-)
MSEDKKEDHPLSLKVMRLSKPQISIEPQVVCEKSELPGPVLAGDQVEAFGVSEFLALPSDFVGDIWMGEKFRCYVSVNNDSDKIVHFVSLKAELQTGSRRFTLFDNSKDPIAELFPGKNLDQIITHTVSERGTHILVCLASYSIPTGEKKLFRKFFKFQVSYPFTVDKAIFSTQNGFALSLDLCNRTPISIFIESVSLNPEPGFRVIDFNPSQSIDQNLPLGLDPNLLCFLKAGSVRQFLFKLEYKDVEDPMVRTYSRLGELTLVWRSSMGEEGSYAEQIPQNITLKSELCLLVTDVPSSIYLEEPFNLSFKLINRGKTPFTPRLCFDQSLTSKLKVVGLSNQSLKEISVGGSVTVRICVFAVYPGLQDLTGLTIIDTKTERSFRFDRLITLLVEQRSN